MAISFLLPLELIDPEERLQFQMVQERARAAGTSFISSFESAQIKALARQAGLRSTKHVSRNDIIQRYFTGRNDGLHPVSGEELLVATT